MVNVIKDRIPPFKGVFLDPFSHIVNVGWQGPLVFIGVAYQGLGAHTLPEDAASWYHRVELKVPSGHEDQIFIGRKLIGAEEVFQTSVPAGPAVTYNQLMMRRVPAAVGLREEVEGEADDSVWARVHIINFHRLYSEFLSELLPDPDEPASAENLPAPLRISYFVGDANELGDDAIGQVRIQIYQPEAFMPFQQSDWVYGENDLYFTYFVERVVAIGGGSPTLAYTLDSILDCMELPTPPVYSQDYEVGAPGNPGDDWDVEWDMFNRTNEEDFPPDGSKPVLVAP